MDLSFADLRRLSDLLKPEEVSSDSDDDLPRVGVAKFGPGDIRAKKSLSACVSNEANDKKDEKAIWHDSEIPDGIEYDESEDPRKRPEYNIKYKQSVTTEDVFLQMGAKTPASSSCEDIVIEIILEKENKSSVDLHVVKQVLELRSEKYRLSLPLPHPVDPESTKAVWEPSTDMLRVVLKMKRDLDFVNF